MCHKVVGAFCFYVTPLQLHTTSRIASCYVFSGFGRLPHGVLYQHHDTRQFDMLQPGVHVRGDQTTILCDEYHIHNP